MIEAKMLISGLGADELEIRIVGLSTGFIYDELRRNGRISNDKVFETIFLWFLLELLVLK